MIEQKIRKQFIIVKSLVVNDKGELLLVRRKREFHKEAHNKWEFPGGKIDFLLPKLLSTKWVTPEREAQQILICYVCKLIGGEKALGDHAVSDIKWFKPKDMPANSECLPGTIDFFELYLKVIKK